MLVCLCFPSFLALDAFRHLSNTILGSGGQRQRRQKTQYLSSVFLWLELYCYPYYYYGCCYYYYSEILYNLGYFSTFKGYVGSAQNRPQLLGDACPWSQLWAVST